MKTAVFVVCLFAGAVQADEYVNGYYRQDGTYVEGHWRSSPNQQRWDNYSSEGNYNPYTGERGTERHEFSPPDYSRQDQGRGGRPSSYRR